MKTSDKEFLAQKIRSQYVEREHDELTDLRALDKKVKRPASIFAYSFGALGALTLGLGMSLAMEIIGDAMLLGIIIGFVGILTVSLTYKLYSIILKKRREKYADEIIKLSEKIINK